jgi:hypothetical protein
MKKEERRALDGRGRMNTRKARPRMEKPPFIGAALHDFNTK